MNFKLIVYAIIILILGIFVGRFISIYFFSTTSSLYIPELTIIGDVQNPLDMTTLEEFQLKKFTYKGDTYEGVVLQNLIGKTEPFVENFDIQLVGNDGLVAQFSGKNLTGCFITFTDKNGWEAINLNYPVSSNVKKLKEIYVVSRELSWDYGINFITSDENLKNVTPGQLLSSTYNSYLKFEGISKVTKDDQTYQTSIFTRRRTIQIEDILKRDNLLSENSGQMLVIGAKGEMAFHKDGFLEIKDNQIDYLSTEEKLINDVKGVILNPPSLYNTDTYYDALHYLETGKRVLIIIMDGFGYHQYEYALENNFVPFISTLKKVKQALSVYQPVTNAGMAAILTGVGPAENGVYSRKQKDMLVPDLFAVAKKSGKKGLLIEGDIKILNTGIEPILNLDDNGNGTIDDEILKSAIENISEDIQLAVVHFHGIDDQGHSSGDLSRETMEVIKRTDDYIAQLVKNFSGKVILTADHGMHKTPEGGAHGTFRFQDLFVPYIITDGGK
ncbi:MAG: alkaline phosphatase family protein [Halanaerobiales bacterium]|nr:alkaline phosphatase family protein [Halanaerobiales bacterium]